MGKNIRSYCDIEVIKNLLRKSKQILDGKVKNFGVPYKGFAIFGILNYPIYYVIWKHHSFQLYENLGLRVTATLLCIFLLLKDYWPLKLKAWFFVYWLVTVTFCLPFFFFFMMLKNNGETVWLMSANTIVFALALIADWANYLIIFLVGTFFAIICYYLTTSTPTILSNYTWDEAAQFFGSLLVVALLAKNKQNFEEEKIKTMRALGATIAHELRTPLSTIRVATRMVRRYLPILEEGYHFAKSHNVPVKSIDQQQCNNLKEAVETIAGETQYANTIINMILENVKENAIPTDNFQLYSINACVKEAIERYPFQPGELELIKVYCDTDFLFKGDKIAMVNVLFNLLKNALYFIASEQKGNIEISCEQGKADNVLYFKDTARGIAQHDLHKLFDRFFTTTRHGTGLGLAYCKMAMYSFGGDISCSSEVGKFTLFKMTFPV